MSIAKAILTFAAQAMMFGYFLVRLLTWRGTEKGQGVLSEIPATLAYWFLLAMLVAMVVASAWFNLGPLLGLEQ